MRSNEFCDLLFSRVKPPQALTHTAFGLMIWRGLKSVESVLVCYVSFVNIPKKGGGGYREFYVKVFDIVTLLAGDRHVR